MILKTVIVDDEDLAIDLLRHFINSQPELQLLETFTSSKYAFEYIKKHQPDVLFLDIQMPQLNGLNLIEGLNYSPIIVLVTAYAEYAQKAYELDVVDYLLKPYTRERFNKSIDKIRQFSKFKLNVNKEIENDCLFVKHNGLLKKINYYDIIYIEGLKQYVRIVTKDEKYITLNSMKSLEDLLIKNNFKRVHKSYIVNFNLKHTLTSSLIKIDAHKIPIGRSYKPTI